MNVNCEWSNCSQCEALGYVLAQKKYLSFDGEWTDANYVSSFLDKNFGMDVVNFD